MMNQKPGRPENLLSNQAATRRDFLRAVAAGTACAPAIVLLGGCARPDASTTSNSTDQTQVKPYELTIGRKQASPDGRAREIFCYNDQLPGPLIRAKLGETLRIKVKNELEIPSSVHWHGMHQPGTWQMDGVGDVSGPPIAPGGEFVYEFKATPAGTHWYHAHVGVEYGDGLFGPLLVDEAQSPHPYDREEVLLFNDWFLEPAEEILSGLLKKRAMAMPAKMKPPAAKAPAAAGGEGKPEMAAMPGMAGKPDVGDVPFESALFNGRGRFDATSSAPLAEVEIRPGETLRLRLINGSSTYAFRFQIDDHRLTVIASDGSPLVPQEVDNLLINVGERYDVLVKGDPAQSSWMRVVTMAGGEGRAILRYQGDKSDPADSPVKWGPDALAPAAMRSPAAVELATEPREIRWKLGGTMVPYRWTINNEEYPRAEPVRLTTGEDLRWVIENPTGMDHPFHLHGHYFYVLGSPEALNLHDPPQKDTINIPAGQTVVLQWKAINPGRWFFHCHIEWHAATGMARVLEIGPGEGSRRSV